MRKIFLLLYVCANLNNGYSQSPNLDELLQKITLEKNDSVRFYLAASALTISETNPVLDMKNAEVILVHGLKINDKVCQVLGLGCLGYDYRAFGNTARSLEYNLKAKIAAEGSNDDRLISVSELGLATNYIDLHDYAKAKAYNLSALKKGAHVEVNFLSIMSYMTMGEIYLYTNQLDSALIHTQRAYEQSMSSGIKDYLGGIYGQLGTIQSRLHNPTLALSYLNLALQEATKIKSPKYINISYHAIAEYYFNANQKDSAILYSKKAIAAVEHTAFSTMKINPSKLLLDIYRHSNVDSAFKYSEMHRVANDSLYNTKTIQQAQLMTFEENARQQELAVINARSKDQHSQNIQFAFIALAITSFIIIFLLLSRRFITNTKVIELLGVFALLIVFEFLNLVTGPFIDQITNHSPILMLLALVAIAGMLVPLHHQLDKLLTTKLVEKNKLMRLAAAKKTIEQLGS
jgi:tetratricopeptide (TPR) repeat protein